MAGRIGIGAERVPARVLPEDGDLKDLEQQSPLGRLPSAERLLLIGLTRMKKNWDGVACLIGSDRSHWVQVSADEAVSFQSFLTPRLAASLAPDVTDADADAAADTLSRPERFATHLSSADIAGSGSAVLGHLIGAELAATRPYWLGQWVVVIGAGALAEAYAALLSEQGVPVETLSPEDCAKAGLTALNAPRA
ncbi:MAG: 2-dehydro-3-deoxygalactonokinase [Thalassovita sp.]|nr:2-dehydro-3-deoxygalactonokinase [Thalassovita sp.]